MSEHMSPIPSRIYNAAVGGHVCGPEDIDFGQKVVHLVKYDRSGNEVSFESQVTQANKIYVIHDDFVLSSNITIPANCVLKFEGGSISGAYTITGVNTSINAGLVKIFNANVIFTGTWNISEAYPEWFGAKADGITESGSIPLVFDAPLIFSEGTYVFSQTVVNNPHNIIMIGNGTKIKISDNATDEYGIFIRLADDNHTHDIFVKNITFEGNANSGIHGILWGYKYKNIVINNVNAYNISNTDGSTSTFRFGTYDNFYISDCELIGGQFAAIGAIGRNTYVQNCVIKNYICGVSTTENDDDDYSPERFYVRNCTFKNIYTDACTCENSLQNSTKEGFAFIDGNTLEDIAINNTRAWCYCICIGNRFNGVVSNNTIKNVAIGSTTNGYGNAITLGSNTSITYGYVVHGNTILNCKLRGISASNAARVGGGYVPVRISDNSIESCNTGIFVYQADVCINNNISHNCEIAVYTHNCWTTVTSNIFASTKKDIWFNESMFRCISSNLFMTRDFDTPSAGDWNGHIFINDKTLGSFVVRANKFFSTNIINVIQSISMTNFEINDGIANIVCSAFNPSGVDSTEDAKLLNGTKVTVTSDGSMFIKTSNGYKAVSVQ